MCESNKSSILNVKLFYGMVRPQNTYSGMIENESWEWKFLHNNKDFWGSGLTNVHSKMAERTKDEKKLNYETLEIEHR